MFFLTKGPLRKRIPPLKWIVYNYKCLCDIGLGLASTGQS